MDNICTILKRLLKKDADFSELCNSDNKEQFIKAVKKAIQNNAFEVHYQPQYNYNTKKMYGAEALMRLNCPNRTEISPSVLVPQLEKSGLIYDVDKLIWRKVCADLKGWLDAGIFVPHLSVNISGNDIYHSDFEEYLTSLIDEFGLEPKKLHLEITETAYMEDLHYTAKVISSLQKHGFVVEMDDFGSGYASLTTLKSVPFDTIKLDMDFLQESETNEKAKNILSSIIDMLRKIETPIIVEGVEHEEQAELLNRLGCKYMQGYYFGKPTDKASFEKILKTESTKG